MVLVVSPRSGAWWPVEQFVKLLLGAGRELVTVGEVEVLVVGPESVERGAEFVAVGL